MSEGHTQEMWTQLEETVQQKSIDCNVDNENISISIYGYDVNDASTILLCFLETTQMNRNK